jgi:peptide/nickel transport system substrate-binding protein
MRILRLAAAAALLTLTCSAAMAQTTLRIGLAEDPDVLDPTLARTYVGRIVFASLCDNQAAPGCQVSRRRSVRRRSSQVFS